MIHFALHPEAFADLADIWEFLAEDNIDAADHLIEEIFDVIRSLPAFPQRGHHRSDLTGRPTSLPMRPRQSHFASLPFCTGAATLA